MGLDPSTHPERCEEAREEGSRWSRVKQEIAADVQTERNNRDDESDFGEQAAERNSYPVDS